MNSPNLKTHNLSKIIHLAKRDISIYIIMLLCILQFFVEYFTAIDTIRILLYPSSLLNLLDNFQYWRLITPVFIHFTLIHLLSNLFLFWYFAKSINAYSQTIFLLLFTLSALLSNAAEFIIVDERFGGISGVNFALFGFIFIYHQFKPQDQLFINLEFSIMVFVYLLLTATDWIGDYSFVSHLSGLLVGLVFGLIFAKRDKYLHKQTSPFGKGE